MRIALVAVLLVATSAAHADCPAAVTSAVTKAVADGTIRSCRAETEDGRAQFEVVVDSKARGKLEIDVLPDGTIDQIEEKIDVSALPDAVTKAFAAKYPGATPTRAEKQTHGDGKISFEVAFTAKTGKKEATFTADGTFVEEE
jgi:hypothetical protein